jgi:hypothetical protein
MNWKLINKLCLFILTVASGSSVFAQGERVYDLNGNARLSGYDEYLRNVEMSSRTGDTLSLPFFDDFSEPFSRLRNLGDDYPNPDKWVGNTVYINNHMAINPLSQGVATFDGLDERGLAYSFGFAIPAVADSLTSACLRMGNVQDTAYLSFYYQAQGLGNAPEQDNPLVVEFKDSSQTWNQVWDVEGYELDDFDFRHAVIPIAGDEYLFNGFQFRFLNYASLSGNVDHWHVDYVKVDEQVDTAVYDLAFLGQNFLTPQNGQQVTSASLLREYHSMPWEHYLVDTAAHMADSCFVAIRNNDVEDVSVNGFHIRIKDSNGTQLFENVQSAPEVLAGRICGSLYNECNDTPANQPGDKLRSSLEGYNYWEDPPSISSDSTYFLVEGVILNAQDDVAENDKTAFVQEFYNYYAYDDGTAEQAYGLGELENVGRVAVKYNIKRQDILRSIQLYLNPVAFDLSDEPVQLAVWTGGEEPGDTIWTSPTINLNYTEHINYFYHYFLDREVQVNANSTIFIGWIQQPATNQKFSIGMDRRTDNSDKVFYNLSNFWQQSSIPGSLMIRPVFGEAYDWVGVEEANELGGLTIYPNPANGQLFIREKFSGQLNSANIQVIDISGRTVFQQVGYQNSLNLQGLQQGIYVLRIDSENGRFTERIVLQ